MMHGPFHTFEALMDDAIKRYPVAQQAFNVVTGELIYKLVDADEEVSDWAVINGLARQCGMVVSVKPDDFGGHEWSYEMTET